MRAGLDGTRREGGIYGKGELEWKMKKGFDNANYGAGLTTKYTYTQDDGQGK